MKLSQRVYKQQLGFVVYCLNLAVANVLQENFIKDAVFSTTLDVLDMHLKMYNNNSFYFT